GLPSVVANATVRLSIVIQNISAITGFYRKGVSYPKFSLYLGLIASVGSIIGTKMALDISGSMFNHILAVVMVVILVLILWNPVRRYRKEGVPVGRRPLILSGICFFFLGIYGGFMHAGIGFLIIAVLSIVNGFDLVKSNCIKVTVALIFNIPAIYIFAMEGKINWAFALFLSLGTASGAWVGSHWSVNNGEIWIRRLLITAVIVFSIKLLGGFNWLFQMFY
ncbi:MAG: sulfite exporter TauE/SafE family protein, partial [Candidatus Margulisbacteria bacterium]|nr:sulfite exporter TauE/SafE family protein [Candidatus Margulisiibacteriota bacterium]